MDDAEQCHSKRIEERDRSRCDAIKRLRDRSPATRRRVSGAYFWSDTCRRTPNWVVCMTSRNHHSSPPIFHGVAVIDTIIEASYDA